MNPLDEARRALEEDPRRAISILRRYRVQLTGSPRASYLLGVAHFRLREFQPAERAFRYAVRLDPTMSRAHYYLGLTMERQGRGDEAIMAYQTSLDLDPRFTKAREKLQQMGVAAKAPRGERRPIRSELDLPADDDEFDDYTRRIQRKRMIDQRAQYAAQVNTLPWYAWAIMAVILVVVLLIGIEAVSMFAGGPSQAETDFCRAAAERGIDHPAC
jgi:tetratricopeptide (TPR) repeat protein